MPYQNQTSQGRCHVVDLGLLSVEHTLVVFTNCVDFLTLLPLVCSLWDTVLDLQRHDVITDFTDFLWIRGSCDLIIWLLALFLIVGVRPDAKTPRGEWKNTSRPNSVSSRHITHQSSFQKCQTISNISRRVQTSRCLLLSRVNPSAWSQFVSS